MADEKIGIVQSPQYFELGPHVHKRSVIEYGASHRQECFYRYIQVARDRFGATVCCGTNAIYRRAALDEIGGTVQAGHSEDQRTGFALQCKGWVVRYVPIILAVGLSPDGIYALYHQRHRWCAGNIELMMKKEFWTSPIDWKAKVSYATGFTFYLHHPLSILFTFQLFWVLFNYNSSIHFLGGIFFYPYLAFTLLYLFFFQTEQFRWGNLYVGL
jgi:cellulose synthase (UDP-forming)